MNKVIRETVGIELERSAHGKLVGFSESLLNREGTIVYSIEKSLKERTEDFEFSFLIYVYSMNEAGSWRKMSKTKTNAPVCCYQLRGI
jgi:hypothetical protein